LGHLVTICRPTLAFLVDEMNAGHHVFTHARPEFHGKSGMQGNDYAAGMYEHDQDVGKLLKALDHLGVAKDTFVIYTTDNGPNMFTWPDAAMTPFRSEKIRTGRVRSASRR
jgi:arylsulfatase A-like enzyme